MSTPSRSARLSVGRNGAPEGIVKTRGARWAMRAFYAARGGRQAGQLGERFGSPPQGCGEPFPCVLIARNPEAQPVRSFRERTREDSSDEKAFKGGARVGMRGQSTEASSADDSPAGAVQEGIEPGCVAAKPRAHGFQPIRIGERLGGD